MRSAIYFEKLSAPKTSKRLNECVSNLLLKITRTTPQTVFQKTLFQINSKFVKNHVAQSSFKDYPPKIILTRLLRVVETKSSVVRTKAIMNLCMFDLRVVELSYNRS